MAFLQDIARYLTEPAVLVEGSGARMKVDSGIGFQLSEEG